MYHPKAWGLWLLAALMPVILTKNPFYLVIAMAAIGLNYMILGQTSPVARQWRAFLRVGVVLVLFSIAFNLLFVSAGDTRLFTLPVLNWEFLTNSQQVASMKIGGTVTLESLVYGLANGMALMGVLITFATFNTLVDHYQLLRSTPRFLYQSAMVVSIAITFVPQLVVAQREIREAQALRGHRFRGVRDLLPLFVTLLAEGLERSITLAESMDARGFGGQPSAQADRLEWLFKIIIVLALVVFASGAFALNYFPNKAIGGVTMLMGAVMLITVLGMIGQNVQRSRYRRDQWRRYDSLIAIASVTTILVILATWVVRRSALIFYPYPTLAWPSFDPLIGLTLLLIAAPALVGRFAREVAYD